MEWWHVVGAAGLVAAGLAALYGLHRLCLWLEARGLLYYWHKKPSSSAAACLVPLQQAVEPAAHHVFHIKEEKRHPKEEDGGGQDLLREPDAGPPDGEGNRSPLTE
jgi:hypothetical protein